MATAAKGSAAKDDAAVQGDNSERIAALDYDACPKCHVGTLRVVGFDLGATHEALQGIMSTPFDPTGGAVHRHCFLCEYHESEPIEKLEGAEE